MSGVGQLQTRDGPEQAGFSGPVLPQKRTLDHRAFVAGQVAIPDHRPRKQPKSDRALV